MRSCQIVNNVSMLSMNPLTTKIYDIVGCKKLTIDIHELQLRCCLILFFFFTHSKLTKIHCMESAAYPILSLEYRYIVHSTLDQSTSCRNSGRTGSDYHYLWLLQHCCVFEIKLFCKTLLVRLFSRRRSNEVFDYATTSRIDYRRSTK